MSTSASPRWRLKQILFAVFIVFVVAALGMTATDLGPWYQGLEKPSWQPPGWLFGPVWTVIYALVAVAGLIAWNHAKSIGAKNLIMLAFGVNILLNIAWSELFFAFRRPDWALIEVVFFWLSILGLMLVLARSSRLAAWLLAPYLAWVFIAAILNFEIVRLNPSFGG